MANKRKVVNTGGGGKILAFLLGMFMGIAAVAGAAGGVVYYLWKKPLKNAVKLIDRKENGEIYQLLFKEGSGLLDPKYAESTVNVLLKDVVTALSAMQNNGTLADLQKLSPKVGAVVDKLLNTTSEYGVPLSKEEMMQMPVKELLNYVTLQIKDTPLSGFIKGVNGKETTEPFLLALCYGEEGVDYYRDETGAVVMMNGAKETTINGLFDEGGVTQVMDKIALESVSGKINKDDPVMRTLAYGSPNRYTTVVDEEGKVTDVQMNQIVYTWDGATLYDIDGEEAEGVFDEGAKTFTPTEGVTYYLDTAARTTSPIAYYAYKDEGRTQKALYPKTKINDLMSDTSSLADGLYLADALKVDGNSHRILISLAYGEGYSVGEDGKVTPAEGVTPRSIGDLKKNSTEIINGMSLADALNVTPTSNNALITLAYGKEGRDYVVEEGEFKMLGDSKPRTLEDISQNMSTVVKDIALADVVDPDFDSAISMYLLYGREGIHYEVVTENEQKKAVPLKQRIAVLDGKAYNPYGEELTGVLDEDGRTFTVTEGEGEEAKTTVYEYVDVNGEGAEYLTLPDGKQATYYFLQKEGKDLYYQPNGIADLSGENSVLTMLTGRLTLQEILGEDVVKDNIFLKHLKGETIDSLPAAIDHLKVTDVYAKEVFKTEEEDGTYYYLDKDGNRFARVDDTLTQEQKDKRVLVGVWWYLLHNDHAESCHLQGHCALGEDCLYKDNDPESVCTAPLTNCPTDADTGKVVCFEEYFVKDLAELISNMTNNIEGATLRQLKVDKVVTNIEDATLDTDVLTSFSYFDTTTNSVKTVALTKTYGKTKLGDFTATEILAYISELLTIINGMQPSS